MFLLETDNVAQPQRRVWIQHTVKTDRIQITVWEGLTLHKARIIAEFYLVPGDEADKADSFSLASICQQFVGLCKKEGVVK